MLTNKFSKNFETAWWYVTCKERGEGIESGENAATVDALYWNALSQTS